MNLVTVTYNNKADFTGTDLVRTDTQTVDLVHPSFTISKDCNPKKVAPSQTVTYTIFVNNTSPDVGLVPFSVVDSLLGNITGNFNSLSAGATQTVTKTRTVLANDPHLLNNTVTATYTLDPSTKLPNKIIHSASCTVEVLRSVVKVTGFGYTNTPSTPIPDRSGIVSGTATFTVKVMNFGPATAVLNGNVTASVTKTSGSFSCTGGLKKDITGSVISGGSAEFSLVCTYTDLHDGAKVQADLLLDYTVEGAGGPRFQASGSPASVSFTIQSD